jgi:hypothetical protein
MRYSARMKSSTIPPLRVEPEFREQLESVLREGETLSSFVETALRERVRSRIEQAEFVARGLASLEEAKRTGITYTIDEVTERLQTKLDKARSQMQSRRKRVAAR